MSGILNLNFNISEYEKTAIPNVSDGYKISDIDSTNKTCTLTGVPQGSGTLIIPSKIISGGVTFDVIKLSDNNDEPIENIEDYTSIIVSSGIKTITCWTFGSNDVESITLPNTLETIESNARAVPKGENLVIYIPKSVKNIGSNIFVNQKQIIFADDDINNWSCTKSGSAVTFSSDDTLTDPEDNAVKLIYNGVWGKYMWTHK